MSETNLFDRLREPFSAASVSWRVGEVSDDGKEGKALPYIDARVVQSRLDEVVGAANWRVEFKASPIPGSVLCVLALRVGSEWVSKEDVAQYEVHGNRSNARELAVKGAASDAFKRAAVMWGIGRYLYDVAAPKVPLEGGKLPSSFNGTAVLAAAGALPAAELQAFAESAREAAQQAVTKAAAPELLAPATPAAPGTDAANALRARPPVAPAKPPVARPVMAAASAPKAPANKPVGPAPASGEVTTEASLPPALQGLGLSAEQVNRVAFILEKSRGKKAPVSALKNYISGERNADLPEKVRQELLTLVEQER